MHPSRPRRLRWARVARAGAVGAALAMALATTAAASPTTSLTTSLTTSPTSEKASWKVTPTPNRGVGAFGRYLTDVSAASATNAWAVGGDSAGPLAVHWDGTKWTATKTPRPAGGSGRLEWVSALKGKDAWGFGVQGTSCASGDTCLWAIHHTPKGWKNVKLRKLPAGFVAVSVHAYSDKSFWAVGDQTALAQAPVAAAVHWDGSSWTKYTVPNPVVGGASELLNLQPVPGKKSWIASGVDFDSVHGFTMYASWTPGGGFTRMDNTGPVNGGSDEGLVVLSATNAFSVGTNQSGEYHKPLIEHWDGSAWKVVKGAKIPGRQFTSGLVDAASGAKNTVVAVGYGTTRDGGTKLIGEKYAHGTWTALTPKNVRTGGEWQNQFFAVASVPGSPRTYLAVGDHGNPSGQQFRADHTLAERCLC